MQSPLDRNYTTSIYNKGALIWRLLEKKIGKNNFDTLIRSLLDRQRVDVLSLNEWRSPLCGLSRCANLKGQLLASTSDRAAVNELFAQWVEAVVLPDFAIGQPQTSAAGVESTIVNFGTGDFTVDVVAVTESGEKINRTATVKGGEYGVITFPAGTRLKGIEVDPDKLYVQKDYANDVYPRLAASADSFGQANLALSKGEFPVAEAKAREALGADPDSPTLQALLGRALLGQNKRDEAQRIFETALKNPLTSVQAYAYSHLGLGEILLQQNKPAEAALHFRLAAAADIDPATTIAARDGALRAERAAGTVKLPDDVKAFLGRLDASILQGSAEAVNPHVDLGNLRRFAQSLVVRKPTAWTTEPLRVEEWDANRVAVDVALKLKIENRDYAGRALYVLSRAGGKLLLSEVPVFDVK
jgi:tetratricopeptide (TPR) repeat protein